MSLEDATRPEASAHVSVHVPTTSVVGVDLERTRGTGLHWASKETSGGAAARAETEDDARRVSIPRGRERRRVLEP
jgi:hypothetical protein